MYDYKKDIKVETASDGKIVLTMSKSTYIRLSNSVYESHQFSRGRGLDYRAEDALELWRAINLSDDEEGRRIKENGR